RPHELLGGHAREQYGVGDDREFGTAGLARAGCVHGPTQGLRHRLETMVRPRVGIPVSSSSTSRLGAPSAWTDPGPPDRMMALGFLASISPTGMVEGTIWLCTCASRTRRAISCACCAPRSTTRTVSNVVSAPTDTTEDLPQEQRDVSTSLEPRSEEHT